MNRQDTRPTPEDIRDYYREQAEKRGADGRSTIEDLHTRHLEIAGLAAYLEDGMRVLEAGCGNGFIAEALVRRFDIRLAAFDFCEDMVALARGRDLSGARGTAEFFNDDLLAFHREERYDVAYTVRALQNLTAWEDQKAALANLADHLESGGQLLLFETFDTGFDNLNAARAELGLPLLTRPWYNLFFEEARTLEYMTSIGCPPAGQDACLSGYYFGSRVLYPSMLPDPSKAAGGSVINDYFQHLPPHGDFAPHKIVRFVKG